MNFKAGFSNLQFEDSDLGDITKNNYSMQNLLDQGNQFTPPLSKIGGSSSNMMNSQEFTPLKKKRPLQATNKIILSPIESPLSLRDLRG